MIKDSESCRRSMVF